MLFFEGIFGKSNEAALNINNLDFEEITENAGQFLFRQIKFGP